MKCKTNPDFTLEFVTDGTHIYSTTGMTINDVLNQYVKEIREKEIIELIESYFKQSRNADSYLHEFSTFVSDGWRVESCSLNAADSPSRSNVKAWALNIQLHKQNGRELDLNYNLVMAAPKPPATTSEPPESPSDRPTDSAATSTSVSLVRKRGAKRLQ